MKNKLHILFLLFFLSTLFLSLFLSLFPTSVFAADAGGDWNPAAGMNLSHVFPSSALLSNEKVLLVGYGVTENGVSTSAELYDAGSNKWTILYTPVSYPYGATVTPLDDGKALVTGAGINEASDDITPAQIYDPSGTWTDASENSTTLLRIFHTSTRLSDGTVLVTGGFGGNPDQNISVLDNSEIYNPAAKSWSPVGSLHTPRNFHTATLLPDGKVLVAGGAREFLWMNSTNTSEVYDPATASWSLTNGNMSKARVGHTATLLPNGKVLVTGGIETNMSNSQDSSSLASTELYDPSTNEWSQAADMTTPRLWHTATLLSNGKVLVSGGVNGANNQAVILNTSEIYDPVKNTWTPVISTMTDARMLHTATLLPDGRVLAAGGALDLFTETALTSAEIYEPPKTPVILIPGIMGSEFEVKETIVNSGIKQCLNPFADYEYTQGDTVWFDSNTDRVFLDYKSCGRYLDVLQLQLNGITENYPQVGLKNTVINTTLLGLHLGYYDTLRFFDEKGYKFNKDFFIFPYDWRKDLSQNIASLNEKIDIATASAGTTKVQIVAHSMGGFIARDYIRDVQRAQKVDTLIELGTPHAGTPTFLAHLLYNKCIKVFNLVCVINGDEINKLVQNFPGAFKLLPNKLYYQLYSDPNYYPFKDSRDVDNNGVKGALNYNQTETMLSNLGKNMPLFDNAESYHDALDESYNTNDAFNTDTNSVKTYLIAGSGQPTIGQIHDYTGYTTVWGGRIELPFSPFKLDADATNGDDTVPLLSATLGKLSHVYYVKQNHSDLPSGTALQMTFNLLNGQIADIPGVSPIPFAFDGKIISVHSPVVLHAYDNLGNHTGLKDDGTVELGIPGSSYDELGESKFIYLPDGGHYNLKTKATEEGSFDLKIKIYTESDLTEEALYLDIPQTASTTASMTLDTDTPVLKVDTNGDGTDIKDIQATSTLTGDAVTDNEPPVTSSQIAGTQGTDNWYRSNVTVALNSQDNNSGVLQSYYYFEEEKTLQAYNDPVTIEKEGVTKLWYFSVDKAGNAEEPKEIDIKIDKIAPEISLQFNPDTKQIEAKGKDAGSGVDSVNQTDKEITVQDKAGNTTKLTIDMKKEKSNDKNGKEEIKITGLSYNDQSVSIPETKISVDWKLDKDNILDKLKQQYEIKDQEKITVKYNENKDRSTIIEKEKGEKKDKTKVAGLKLIQLKTDKGKLMFTY
ncbi:hypothetical protein KJ980_04315 [Patescibacteria group bacterium]|nr:hypothetical protein [Patescibacteria group bacterium]MBU4016454.1 hypothetical protein [Patescibacteria group bacterium]MBU4098847.1 hypothetical protein [Patescibacteria group bacterium]